MFCYNCGAKVKENSNFCSNCGAKLVEETTNNLNNVSDVTINEEDFTENKVNIESPITTKNILIFVLCIIAGFFILPNILFFNTLSALILYFGYQYCKKYYKSKKFLKLIAVILVTILSITACVAIKEARKAAMREQILNEIQNDNSYY